MNQNVTIVEIDSLARKALKKVLKKEGLADLCVVQEQNPAADRGFIIRLLEPGKTAHGNHDFTKPVRAGVIVQYVKTLLTNHNQQEFIKFRTYTLNVLNHELLDSQSGKSVRLTEKESYILKLLVQNPGKIVSRKRLLDSVWQYADGIETHTLETHIYRLRQKIEKDPANPSLLITEEAGYRLV
jgi:DNA-binding response OmpR family regulator